MASIRTAGPAQDFGELQIVNEIDLNLREGRGAGSSVRTARAKHTVWVADPRRPAEVYTILDTAPADADNLPMPAAAARPTPPPPAAPRLMSASYPPAHPPRERPERKPCVSPPTSPASSARAPSGCCS